MRWRPRDSGADDPAVTIDMFVDLEQDPRTDPPGQGDERATLLGLVRHLAGVERGWFRRSMAGEDVPPLYSTAADPDADFTGAVADPAVVAEAWQAWRAEVAWADRYLAEVPDLDGTWTDPWRGPLSLRWVLVHMIEEYARHIGHVDLLRERIDGRVGQ